MARVLHYAAVAMIGLISAAVAGCASTGSKDAAGASAAGGGMMCPTCKTVWTFETTDQGSKTQRLEAKPGMTCPDCDAMAAAYMKDGQKVLHNCETCKVTPTVLTPGSRPMHPHGTH